LWFEGRRQPGRRPTSTQRRAAPPGWPSRESKEIGSFRAQGRGRRRPGRRPTPAQRRACGTTWLPIRRIGRDRQERKRKRFGLPGRKRICSWLKAYFTDTDSDCNIISRDYMGPQTISRISCRSLKFENHHMCFERAFYTHVLHYYKTLLEKEIFIDKYVVF
jgi:hypothetical protein